MPQRYGVATYCLIVYRDVAGRPHLIKRSSYDRIMAIMCSSQIANNLRAQGFTAWEFKRDPLRYEH